MNILSDVLSMCYQSKTILQTFFGTCIYMHTSARGHCFIAFSHQTFNFTAATLKGAIIQSRVTLNIFYRRMSVTSLCHKKLFQPFALFRVDGVHK